MAIRELGYVVVETARPAEWRSFLEGVVGAMPVASASGTADDYRIDARPFRLRIVKGGADRLVAAAYEVDSRASLDALASRVEQAGHGLTWGSAAAASERHVDTYFSVRDPAGNGLEFYVGHAVTDEPFVSPQGVSGFVTGEFGMGHAVFAAPDFAASHAFYRDVLGFHDTDLPEFKFSPDPAAPGMHFAFMHADNGRHHAVALGEMPQVPTHCIHIMLEMETISDVGKCHDRMRAAGVPESASIGRHVNDETLGFYMRTPSGFDLEIGCDSLVIDPKTWRTTAHERPSEWGHVWAAQSAEAETAEAAA